MINLELQGALAMREVLPLMIQKDASKSKLLKLFPLTKRDEWQLVYERLWMMTGLQNARGEGGPTGPLPRQGLDQLAVDPGMYGDHGEITEMEANKLREVGDIAAFQGLTRQLDRITRNLTDRYINRLQYNIALMLINGTFTANDATGREQIREIYNIPQYTPGDYFDDLAGSTPLAYLRNLIPKLELGVSVNFRQGAMLMSRPTANLFVNNANSADLGGKRLNIGSTINSVEDVNKILVTNDLPQIEVIDDGYYPNPPSTGRPSNFQRFFTNGKVVLVGAREDGEPIGEYRLCRAIQNGVGSKPGEWYKFKDNTDQHPWNMVAYMGHNGGPVPYYPEAIAVVNAALSSSTQFQ